jgi:hypothetical protein
MTIHVSFFNVCHFSYTLTMIICFEVVSIIHKSMQIHIPRYDLFFTCWAIIAHILCYFGLFYNTTALAIFVTIFAEIINFTINEQFSLTINFLSHYIPLILVLILIPFKLDARPIFILLILYLLYQRFNLPFMVQVYKRPDDYSYGRAIKITL